MAYDAAVILMTPEPAAEPEEAPTHRVSEDEAPAEASAPPGRRWPWILLGVLIVLLLGGGVGALVLSRYLPSMAGDRAVAGAKERGFDLGFQSIDVEGVLPWDDEPARITLKGVKLKNVAAPDVSIDVEQVSVTMKGLDPASVDVVGPSVYAPSLPALFAFEDAIKSGPSKSIPVTSTDVRLRVDRIAETLPLAVVAEAKQITAKDGVIEIEGLTIEPSIPFVDLGIPPVSVSVEREEDRMWLRFADVKAMRLGVNRAATRAFLELDGLGSGDLPKWLPIGLPGKSVTGKLDIALSGPDALSGSFDAAVKGYVPPHPRELQGILFGDTTKVSSKVKLDGMTVLFDDFSIKAGSLELKGGGNLGLSGTLKLDLKGVVPCSSLAVSAIAAHLGPTASMVAGRLARGRLAGNVETRVTVEADVRDVAKAKVIPSAFVRCSIAI